VFAVAAHLTDVRDGLIRGVRSVVLMLLSWLLLLMTVLAAGFLAALPFTGLQGLWDTGSATALVLAAAAALIILINTAYQDGRADNLPPAALRIAVRVAAVLLTPLVVIAFWGLFLRIGQYGLTPDRIIAFACALIGAAYAAGYGYAALSPFWRKGTGWMRPLERTNVATAVLEVAVILALFSPVADPARLSVADQVARLERGAVTPDQFDYRFLRFHSGRTGEAALERLTHSSEAVVARSARNVMAMESRWEREEAKGPDQTPIIASWPEGSALPGDFLMPVAERDPRHACRAAGDCVATQIDLNGDGQAEVLLANDYVVDLFARDVRAGWQSQGTYRPLGCHQDKAIADPREALRGGAVHPVPAPWPDLSFGGVPAQLNDALRCRRLADAAAAAP